MQHIGMNHIEQLYLEIIHNICTGSDQNIKIPAMELEKLASLAMSQSSCSFLLPYLNSVVEDENFSLNACEASHHLLPDTSNALQRIKHQGKLMMLNYYQIDQFTHRIADLLENNHISYVLLKGISLADFYPVPEYRSLGDVDIYIGDRDMFDRADKLLCANGFTRDDDLGDHHVEYQFYSSKIKRTFILELHYRIVGLYQYSPANQLVDRLYDMSSFEPSLQLINERLYPVLPATLCTFYMIHHMLRHYLFSGFGVRLLCDFTFYLEHNAKQIDFEQIHQWCSKSKIFHLYEIILETCRIYLGLPDDIDPSVHYDKGSCESFISQLLLDGDVSHNTALTLIGSTSYKNVTPFTYFKEGHHQMLKRFKKLGKCPVLWPVLWFITLTVFLYNTYFLRHTTFKQSLSNFKRDNDKALILRVFDNDDN